MTATSLGTFVTYNPLAVSPDDPLNKVMHYMQVHGICHMPVVDSEHNVVGVVSDLDVARAQLAAQSRLAIGAGAFPEECPAEAVMARQPTCIAIDAAPREALRAILDRGIHSLPVVEEGRLVGMVTSSDFLRELSYGQVPACRSPLHRYMTVCENRAYIDSTANLEQARSRMQEQGLEHLAITVGDCPIGIVSLRDLRRALNNPLAPLYDRPVVELLTREPATVRSGDNLGTAAGWMLDQRVKAVAVVDRRNRLIGLLTEDDILEAMLADL